MIKHVNSCCSWSGSSWEYGSRPPKCLLQFQLLKHPAFHTPTVFVSPVSGRSKQVFRTEKPQGKTISYPARSLVAVVFVFYLTGSALLRVKDIHPKQQCRALQCKHKKTIPSKTLNKKMQETTCVFSPHVIDLWYRPQERHT